MTNDTARRTRTLADVLTPAAVDAVNEVADTDAYRDAVAMLPALARRHADADDVASLAAVLLGEYLAGTDREPSDAARLAVARAARWVAMLQQDRTDVPTVPVGDTFGDADALPSLARTRVPGPDAVARWTTRDTVTAVLDAVDPASAAILTAGATDACQDKRAANGVSAVALAAAHGVTVTRGRASAVWGDRYRDALSEVRALTVPTAYLPDAGDRVDGGERMRWADVLTGPASPVVRTAPIVGPLRRGEARRRITWATWPNGAALTLANGQVATSAHRDTFATVLTLLVAGDHGSPGTVREVTEADVLGSTDPTARGAAAVPGVRPGVRVGHAVAGMGTAYRRPASRKRKRDGGIGGPMTRG